MSGADKRVAARVTLNGGRCSAEYASGNFHFNGKNDDLAHVTEWELEITDSPANEKQLALKVADLSGKNAKMIKLRRGAVQAECFDLEIHYEPKSHLPFGSHVPSTPKAGMISTHFLAFYNLVETPERVELPVCRGEAKEPAPKGRAILGSDPVTCVHSSGDPGSDTISAKR